jgi:hypothetical protein
LPLLTQIIVLNTTYARMPPSKTLQELVAERSQRVSPKTAPAKPKSAHSQASSTGRSQSSKLAPITTRKTTNEDIHEEDVGIPPVQQGYGTPKSFADFMKTRSERAAGRSSQAGSVRSAGSAVTSQSVLDALEEVRTQNKELAAQNKQNSVDMAELKAMMKSLMKKKE